MRYKNKIVGFDRAVTASYISNADKWYSLAYIILCLDCTSKWAIDYVLGNIA